MKLAIIVSMIVIYGVIGGAMMLVTPSIALGFLLGLSVNVMLTAIVKLAIPTWYKIMEDNATHDIVHDAIKSTLYKTHMFRVRSEETFEEFKREVDSVKKDLKGKNEETTR